MERSARLAPIVERIGWASGPSDLLRVAPELIAETPPMDVLDDGPAILLASPEPFLASITAFLCECVEDGGADDGFVDASEATVREDPVVQALLPLWLECGRPGCQNQVLPALATAWASSQLVSGEASWLNRLPGEVTQGWGQAHSTLASADEEARNALVRSIADRLSARLGASLTLAQLAGVRIPAGGLVRRIMTNPLVFAFPHGALSPGEELGAAASLLRNPLDVQMLSHLFAVAERVWSNVLGRVTARQASAVDNVLHHLMGSSSGAAVLMDPVAGPAMIRSLPGLAEAKDLQSAGLDARVSRALLSEKALRPLAAAWTDLIDPLRSWEVISALSSLITPVWAHSSGWQIRGQHHKPAARWSLRVPRNGQVEHAVVAVRLTELVDAAQSHGARGREVILARWLELLEEFPGAVSTWTVDTGLAVFVEPGQAVKFAEKAHGSFPGPEGILSKGRTGVQLAVSPDLRVGVGLAWGRVEGGTDGEGTWLEGPAVGMAVALTGRGSPTLRAHDPLSIRRVAGQPDGLHSDGIVADSRLIDALRSVCGHPIHVHGSGEEVAGIADDFHFYPVPYWWEDESRVWMWLELGGRLNGGPAELTVLNRVMFRDIHSRDRALERSDIQEGARAVSGRGPDSDAGTGAGWSAFDALERGDAGPGPAMDPWAQLGSGPEVEIDDE